MNYCNELNSICQCLPLQRANAATTQPIKPSFLYLIPSRISLFALINRNFYKINRGKIQLNLYRLYKFDLSCCYFVAAVTVTSVEYVSAGSDGLIDIPISKV